jgi:hypothetical protein
MGQFEVKVWRLLKLWVLKNEDIPDTFRILWLARDM